MGGATGKTVLVVDDDASLRMLCRINLELDGYRVLEAGSKAEGAAALAEGAVDAVLLDVHLGDGDGRDLLAVIGADGPPVALFTGSDPIDPDAHAGAAATLPKPFDLETLRETVRRLVAGRDVYIQEP